MADPGIIFNWQFSKGVCIVEETFNRPILKLLQSLDHIRFCNNINCDFNLCWNFKQYMRMLKVARGPVSDIFLQAFQRLIFVHAIYVCRDKECNLPFCYFCKIDCEMRKVGEK